MRPSSTPPQRTQQTPPPATNTDDRWGEPRPRPRPPPEGPPGDRWGERPPPPRRDRWDAGGGGDNYTGGTPPRAGGGDRWGAPPADRWGARGGPNHAPPDRRSSTDMPDMGRGRGMPGRGRPPMRDDKWGDAPPREGPPPVQPRRKPPMGPLPPNQHSSRRYTVDDMADIFHSLQRAGKLDPPGGVDLRQHDPLGDIAFNPSVYALLDIMASGQV